MKEKKDGSPPLETPENSTRKQEGGINISGADGKGRKQERSHRYSAERHHKNFSSPTASNQKNSSKSNLSLSQDQDVSAGKGKKLDGSSIGSRFTDSSKEKSNDQKTTEGKDGSSSNEKEETEEEKEQKTLKEQEEDIRVEEEAKALEEAQRLEDEKRLANETKVQTEERINGRMALRVKNIEAHLNRPDESFFKQLDSSMKKNTTFVKKLRSITEQQREQLIAEFKGLNLNKFIQEVVTSITEAKMKVADVGAAAHLCSLLHQRYTEFTPLLKRKIVKNFDGINCKDDEKGANVSKLRISLRLLGELVLDGVYTNVDEGVHLLHNMVQNIVNSDKTAHVYAPVILTIVRHCGEDLAGILPRKNRCWKEKLNIDFPRLGVVPDDQQSLFLCLFKEYYESLAKHLATTHKDLQNRERQNRQTIGLKGELPTDRREAFERAQKSYEKLHGNTTSLAEMLDEDMPDLPEDQIEEREENGSGINIFTPTRGIEYDSENGLWEDEDTRTFYEEIKDLKVLVPQILFKEKEPAVKGSPHKGVDKKKKKERKLRHDLNLDDDLMSMMDDFDDDFDDNYEQEVYGEADDDDSSTNNISMAAQIEAFLTKLPNSVNRDFIDQAAEDFIMKLNTKGNRKKLVRELFNVNRIRLDLLPFYSRLVATLAPCLPDVPQDLVWLLKKEIRFQLRKKDQILIESKIKNVRFLGELTKFNACPKAETLFCLKLLLEDFSHHHIEMACNLLETCGRYLYRSPESHPNMARLLEQMMRKKSVQSFDSRQATMIENAFYYCNPPERPKIQKKTRPPMHEYIRKLLYKDLSKTTTEKVLRQVRKLPWVEDGISEYVVKCLSHIWNIKFNNIRCAANMLAGLAEYHDDVAVNVIDNVLENVRLGMETNRFRCNQRRVSTLKYLGEIYNYQLIEADIIFNTLYGLITFGSCVDLSLSELDPPEHLFRIQLVCTLLDTCGQYFDRGQNKKKLDCFLVFFQCYIWQKKDSPYWTGDIPFPREVDYMISDTIEALRPKMKIYDKGADAKEALHEMTKDYNEKYKEIMTTPLERETGSDADSSLVQSPVLSSSPFGTSPFGENLSQSPSVYSQSSQSSQEETCEEDEEWEVEESEWQQNGYDEEQGVFEMDPEQADEVLFKESLKIHVCEEDDQFKAQFDKMIGDSFQNRMQEKAPNVDIAIPMNLKGKNKKQPISDKPDAVNFVLMLKKGNKPVLKDLHIPINSDLAANIHDKQMAQRAEHEEMKRLVLDYNQRQEEESYNEMIAHNRQSRNFRGGGGGNYYRGGPGGPGGHYGGHQRRGNHRLRSRDAEQHLFSPSNRR